MEIVKNVPLYTNEQNIADKKLIVLSPSSLPFDDTPKSGSNNVIDSNTIYNLHNELRKQLTYTEGTGIDINKNKQISLASLANSPKTVGSANRIPRITYDKYGRITGAAQSSISLTGLEDSIKSMFILEQNFWDVGQLNDPGFTYKSDEDGKIYKLVNGKTQYVKKTLIPTNIQWYRKWSNGILEQGGEISYYSGSEKLILYFHVPFADINFHFFRNHCCTGEAGSVRGYNGIYSHHSKENTKQGEGKDFFATAVGGSRAFGRKTCYKVMLRIGIHSRRFWWYAIGRWKALPKR